MYQINLCLHIHKKSNFGTPKRLGNLNIYITKGVQKQKYAIKRKMGTPNRMGNLKIYIYIYISP